MLSHRTPRPPRGNASIAVKPSPIISPTATATTTTKTKTFASTNNGNSIGFMIKNHSSLANNNNTAVTKRHRRTTVRQIIMFILCILVAGLTVLNLHGRTLKIDGGNSNSNDHTRSSISGSRSNNNNNNGILPFANSQKHSQPLQHPQSRVKKATAAATPTHHACDGYRGIYHIEKGDSGGAAGTVFFQFVIGQIMWAEQHNFKPWVYLNNVSYVIYDEAVHGGRGRRSDGVTVDMQQGMEISYVRRPMGHRKDAYPGDPFNATALRPHRYHFDGDGVWENYFEPVSDFVPGDQSCVDKPLVTMDMYLVTPGVHGFAPWAPKCWRYHYLPDYITKPHLPITEWLGPHRHAAHDVLKRYIFFQPHIQEHAERVNPDCNVFQNACLGIHIRQSDKAAGRRQIQTDEFLPFVETFLKNGGKWVYLATDSGKVMQHIQASWPDHVQRALRSMGNDVVRSNDFQAVFDIGSHHRTNTEILIEILALSNCQFMIHGLSAVTESSIWINVDLHDTSVNLEDPEHLSVDDFGQLVKKVIRGENATEIMHEKRIPDWWTQYKSLTLSDMTPTNTACNSYDGILHIAHAGRKEGVASSFFTSVMNQLLYAEKYNLKPWIFLGEDSEVIYDDEVHGNGKIVYRHRPNSLTISESPHERNRSLTFPGTPSPMSNQVGQSNRIFKGNGIWTSYLDQVSDFVPGDKSCAEKPFLSISQEMVKPALNSWAPWSIKAWQYDDLPDVVWKPANVTLRSWLEPMRIAASRIIKKYYHFHPFIVNRAQAVNPLNETSAPCLAVHLRNTGKDGIHREKFPPKKFLDYFNAFARAGGKYIYIASDSTWTLEYIDEHFPFAFKGMIRTQGKHVVRSSWKWPTYKLERHHRTNSETLVDILAMSKCQLLLHGNSAVSEAAVYLNLRLHNHSVNLEDPDRINSDEFEHVSRQVLGTIGQTPVDLESLEKDAMAVEQHPALERPKIIKGDDKRLCRKNAIVYLAQKQHSSYGRDSFGILLESLQLVNKNYLSLNNHMNNTDVMIFHTSDFTNEDMELMESNLGPSFRSTLQFVDLSNTTYWHRPSWHRKDNPLSWYGKLLSTDVGLPLINCSTYRLVCFHLQPFLYSQKDTAG